MTGDPIQVADDIGIVDGETVSFCGFAYPARSVIVRLPDKINMAHGVWQAEGGKAFLEKTFAWV